VIVGLPANGEYLDESFGIDREGLEPEKGDNLDALPKEYWK
jgi:hypothetical protein